MLENQRWQPIPGSLGAEIYPLTRKPDVCCSNAYIIRTASEILLVDTGADPVQMAEIVATVRVEVAARPRPVILLLTHCHLDHCLALIRDTELCSIAPLLVAAHEEGALALERGDTVRTLAEMFHWEILPRAVEIHLLAASDRTVGGRRTIAPGISLSTETVPIGGGISLDRQTLTLESGELLEVYHTPGHTPDSICIGIGEFLFTSDLLFSTGPGIAGCAGWDPAGLAASIERLCWLLENRAVTLCCSGHGRAVAPATVIRLCENLRREAAGMADIGAFTPGRLRASREHAIDLLGEAGRLFSVIAGRLYLLAYTLEELGEEEEAQKYQNLIEADRIDEFLTDFNEFVTEFAEGSKIELQLVLKAVQITQRIGGLFAQDRLDHIVDASLLRRTERLLSDFMNTVFGYGTDESPGRVALNPLLEELVVHLCRPPVPDEAFIEAADDEAAYREALVSRLAYLPLFEDVRLELALYEPLPPVLVEPERFFDTVAALLEHLASGGVRDIRVATWPDDTGVRLGIAYAGCRLPAPETEGAIRLFRRGFTLCGASLACREGEDMSEFVLTFRPADSSHATPRC
ncbi:MBL fold metallo-hydrolase [Methanoculleus taiwanensis]|uniref:MBL fold metallo-hydrolase n=1 Tax=Methanoculleus taiwanensis TaxID=1550565 RepID=UPI0013E8A538|nr:MBL fold metallo-hydrolase [Methanoculleus taiwanensis]